MTGEKCGKGDARHACDPGSSSKPESLTVGFRKETALQGCKAVADIISGMLAGVDAPLMFEWRWKCLTERNTISARSRRKSIPEWTVPYTVVSASSRRILSSTGTII